MESNKLPVTRRWLQPEVAAQQGDVASMLVRDSAGIGAVSGELRLGRQAIDGLAENLADALQPRLGILVSLTVRERFNRDLGSDVEPSAGRG